MTDLDLSEAAFLARRLPLGGTFNVRDVGGYPAGPGRQTRRGRLLRGDALHRMDRDGAVHLAGLGLETVVDLRRTAERESSPDAFHDLDVRVVHVPILDESPDAAPITSLEKLYLDVIDRRGPALAAAVAAIAEPGALPAMVHCTGGKDRTGLVTALVLGVLGVPDEVIIADFAATSLFLTAEVRATLAPAAGDGLSPEVAEGLLGCHGGLMVSVLERVRDGRDGGPAGYLLEHGLDPSALDVLRAEMLTDTGPEV